VRSIHRPRHEGASRPAQTRQAAISLFAKQRVALIALACRPPREVGTAITHWSAEELRREFILVPDGADISADTIARVLASAQLQPHRQRYYLTSRDPLYDEKRRDIVRLYLDPPPGATVLCLDEKPNIQALGRKHPDLAMRPGYPLAREFEYVRHGVLHLFAAFNVRSGRVDAEVYKNKTRWEFIEFLEQLAWRYRQGAVHAVVDNASYHSTPEVKAWLAAHPRFVFHFTPTHASWLNQVECWFSILTKKAVARGVFNSQRELRAALLDFVVHWNLRAHPFNWAYGEELIHDDVRVAA
jgi:transposase